MAAPPPALQSTFQSTEGGQGGGAGTLLLPFKGTTQKLHTSLPFVSHQPGIAWPHLLTREPANVVFCHV